MRLFIAVDLSVAVRERLDALILDLRRDVPDVRWVGSDRIHLTLKFLGEVDEARAAAISDAVGPAAAAVPGRIPASVGRLGTFGDQRRPRVVWAGVEDPSGGLLRIQSAVETACEVQGFSREGRPFSPHLTLARLKGPSRSLGTALEARQAIRLGDLEISSCCLFQSLLRPDGAAYVRLREYPLGGAA